MLILPTTYFGPISWYRQLNAADTCYIDATEPFHKRTTRNRCTIATPNGPQTLTVPVEHRLTPSLHAVPYADTVHQPIPITSLRISEHNKWRHVHWQALETAYGNSPFFDYYADDIRPFFEPHWEYLFDLNLAIIQKMCELLQVETSVSRSVRQYYSHSSLLAPRSSKRILPSPRSPHGLSPQSKYSRPALQHGQRKHPLPVNTLHTDFSLFLCNYFIFLWL